MCVCVCVCVCMCVCVYVCMCVCVYVCGFIEWVSNMHVSVKVAELLCVHYHLAGGVLAQGERASAED